MSDSTREGARDEAVSTDVLERMLRIRRFESRVGDLYADGDVPGFMHLSNGHEASHVGISLAKDDDEWWVPGGARINGQALAAGLTMREVLAEIYGKATGSNRGKGGHMHVSNVDERFYGSAATIGQGPNPAAGFALAEQMKDTGKAVVSVMGDGTTTRGTFHTGLNLASVWNLPVVFVIENNEFALSYHTDAEVGGDGSLARFAESYDIPARSIDGSDVEAVRDTVSEALAHAREGNGPTVIEHKLHRLEGHYVGDKENYREQSIEEIRNEFDPVRNYRRTLEDAGLLTEEAYAELVDSVDEAVEEAVQFVHDSDFPDRSSAYEDRYRTPLYGQEE